MMKYDPDFFAEVLAFDSGIYKLETKAKRRRRRKKKVPRQRNMNNQNQPMADGVEQRTYKGKSKNPPKYWIETYDPHANHLDITSTTIRILRWTSRAAWPTKINSTRERICLRP